jgi:hypothetical protein
LNENAATKKFSLPALVKHGFRNQAAFAKGRLFAGGATCQFASDGQIDFVYGDQEAIL